MAQEIDPRQPAQRLDMPINIQTRLIHDFRSALTEQEPTSQVLFVG
jgi:hypothetical protein